MPRRYGFNSIRFRLLLLILLTVTPAMALILFTANEQRTLAVTEAEENTWRVLRPAAALYERRIEGTRQMLSLLAQHPVVRERQGAACTRLFSDLLSKRPALENLGVAGADGRVWCSAAPGAIGLSHAEQPYFQRVLKNRDFAIGEYRVDSSTAEAELPFGYPVVDGSGDVVSVVFASLKLDWLNRLSAELRLPEGSVLLMVDREGRVLVRHPHPEVWVGKLAPEAPVLEAILSERTGVAQAAGLDGLKRLFVFSPLDGPAESPSTFLAIGTPESKLYERADAMLVRNMLLLALVGLLMLAVAWFGSDVFFVRRINRLVATTEALAAGGFEARTGLVRHNDELGRLARAIDEMAAHLGQYVAQLKQSQAGLAEARELDRLKTDFVNAVSHELRTPLTTIKGYAELLEDGVAGELMPQQRAFVTQIDSSLGRLERLVDDLLDFARLQAGTFKLTLQEADLGARVQETVAAMRPLADAAQLRLAVAIDPDLPPLRIDAQRIAQVLTNLVSNAIKFTPPGGTITITTRRHGDRVRTSVTDTGPGIAPEDVPRLFQKFSQLESGARKGGTGLGLNISRGIVEAHGGTIGVESTPGQGSTFWFELPLNA